MQKLLLYILISSCFAGCRWEPEEQPQFQHQITGRLLHSCSNPVPIEGAQLRLYSNTVRSGIFFGKLDQQTITDSSGYFTFSFKSENWVYNDGRTSTYYAELQDSTRDFLLHGIEPGVQNIGNVYLDREHWVNLYVSVIKSSIKPGDTLELKPGYSSYNYFTHGSDTAHFYEPEPISGKNHGGPEVKNNGVYASFRILRAGSQIAYGREFIPLNICDTAYHWEFAVPDSVYN